MMTSRNLLTTVTLALLALAGSGLVRSTASDTPPAGRLWPLPIQINLASSFGEYRSGHLHAGVDIKTRGREGVPCIAVDDGYVSRVRAAPNGYGKALYLALDSGETVVYAHLAEFAPPLEDRLYDEQRKLGRYKVDFYPDRGEFPVRRGDVIGYSGSTGASAPHLHFEVRDEKQNPMNPLSHGWALEDEVGPRFKSALWLPLTGESRVHGRCQDREVALTSVRKGVYTATDTLVLEGRIGLGAYIIDRLNASSGRLAPYSVEMVVEGIPFSSITLERFTYSHTGEVELAYEMERVRARNHHYLLLFRREGESLWNRTFVNDGIIDTRALGDVVGEHRALYTAVVRATDRAGNVSTAFLPFYVGGRETDSGVRAGDDGSDIRGGEIPGCYFFGSLLSVDTAALPDRTRFMQGSVNKFLFEDLLYGGGTSHGGLEKPGPGERVRAARVDDFPGPVHVLETVDEGEELVTLVLPLRQGQVIGQNLGNLGVGLSTGERSLYADAFLFLQPWRGALEETRHDADGLRPASEPILLGPLSLVLRRPVELRSAVKGPIDGREAFYRLDERRGAWSFESSAVRGDSVYAYIRSPGVYAVFVDDEPPRIAAASIGKRRSYATNEFSREIIVRIEDDGSGVDAERTKVFVNGKKQIARWNGFSNKMFVPLRAESRTGREKVSVIAYDMAGNTSKKDISLRAESRH